jgi:hypothetical protein
MDLEDIQVDLLKYAQDGRSDVEFRVAIATDQFGCSALHQNIREQINNHPDYKGKPLETGPLTLISLIPHIYKKRDSTEFGLMRTRIYNRQMAGNWKFQYVL